MDHENWNGNVIGLVYTFGGKLVKGTVPQPGKDIHFTLIDIGLSPSTASGTRQPLVARESLSGAALDALEHFNFGSDFTQQCPITPVNFNNMFFDAAHMLGLYQM